MPIGAFKLNGLGKFTVTAVGEVIRAKKGIQAIGNAQISTAQSKFGGSSALFDGSGDYLKVEPKIELASSNFTMEAWIRTADNQQRIILSKFSSAYSAGFDWTFYQSSTGKLVFQWWDGGFKSIAGTTTLSLNTWIHVAAVRNGSTLTIYINGVSDGSTTASDIRTGTAEVWVGAYSEGSGVLSSWNGYLDEVRISNTARYTANFTPSTTAFVNDENTLLLLHMNGTNASTYFEDDNGVRSKKGIQAVGNTQISTAQSKFGGSSALFDGTGDYLFLNSTTTTDLNFGTNSFTIEFWVYPTTNGDDRGVITTGLSSWGSGTWGFYGGTSAYPLRLQIYDRTGGYSPFLQDNAAMALNTWTHYAIVRNGNSWTMYKNGTSVSTGTWSGSINIGQGGLVLGSIGWVLGQSAYGLIGRLDEVRISNTARYTANFTPSTTAFVNDANTLLLMHMDGTNATTYFDDDNGVRSKKGVLSYGNAQISTAQSKFGGASAVFDGTNDGLVVKESADLFLSTNNFTIEMWVRTTARTQLYPALAVNETGSGWNANSWNLSDRHNSAPTKFTFWVNNYNSGAPMLTSTTTVSNATWYHIAIVRNGTNFKMYINGAEESSATFSGSVDTSGRPIIFGQGGSGQVDSSYNGYIDEVRISNTARYTANFTAPTAPFQNDSNTLLLLHMDGTNTSTVFVDDNGTSLN